MPIPTSRTKENAEIHLDDSLCIGCGLCISVCKDNNLKFHQGKAEITGEPYFGCIGCGHCMAVCPKNAIKISGRELSPESLFDLKPDSQTCDYRSLLNLLEKRRSIREFQNKEVPQEILDKILEAAVTAPMGIPPSDVNVVIYDTKEKVQRFSSEFCVYLQGLKWLVSNPFLTLMRPLWGKEYDDLFRNFVKPLIHIFTENMEKGIDLVTYSAPVAMYFYGSPYADPADPVIAATYAMIAAESLGLSTCMIGSVHPLIQYGKKARAFRESQGIQCQSREGLVLVLGYADISYKKGIKRSFASVRYKE